MPSDDKNGHSFSRRSAYFKISGIPSCAEEAEVKLAIANAYHSAIRKAFPRRQADPNEPEGHGLTNLKVEINYTPDGSGRLKPNGYILIPAYRQEFKDYLVEHPVLVSYWDNWSEKTKLNSEHVKIVEDFEKVPRRPDVEHLKSTPWQNPILEREHKQRLEKLTDRPQVLSIEFGFDHFHRNPRTRQTDHRFYVEWCRKFDGTKDARCFLEFIDAIHVIQLEIGDHTSTDYHFIKVRYDNVREIAIKDTTIIFSLWYSPQLEKGPVNYTEQLPRNRLSGLDEQHKRVMAIFPRKFRVTLYSQEEMMQFITMVTVVGLYTVPAHRGLDTDDGLGSLAQTNGKRTKRRQDDFLNYLSGQRMKEINRDWLGGVPFSVAFQVAAMLQNGLLNPIEIRDLKPSIDQLMVSSKYVNSGPEKLADLLHNFMQSIPSWTLEQRIKTTLEERFNVFKERYVKEKSMLSKILKPGWFWSYRAIVTPTIIKLEGPLQEQSNGIIRRYAENSGSFLRVAFMDEDRLQMRWDRNIDSEQFVRERLGSLLNEGFEIAGRHFSYLGHSNSGLREHSFWFVTPFRDRVGDIIDADTIRNRIGLFENKKDLKRQPAKYAARLAQAFSTTEPSIELLKGEIYEVSDIVPKGFEKPQDSVPNREENEDSPALESTDEEATDKDVTDTDAEDTVVADTDTEDTDTEDTVVADTDAEGTVVVNTDAVDTDVADKETPKPPEFTDGYGCMSLDIADEIWKALNVGVDPLPTPAPAAYQVRIGGAKGVIGINPKLKGRKIRLYSSMVKFDSEDRGLHIATKFDHPLPLFLNRPLIAILENQGVKLDWFMRLQERALSEADDTMLSITEKAADFFTTRHLGTSFGFANIVRHLARNKITRLDLEEAPHPMTDFFLASLDIAMVHVDRDLKYKARIPVPTGLSLVGVADVHDELDEGCVYICIQNPDEKKWKYYPAEPGPVYVTRSPSIHPGDVRELLAVHPPKDSIYYKHPLINCLVFSCKGKRPPASEMGGGDLDGDLYQIIPKSDDCKMTDVDQPAEYPPATVMTLDRDAEIGDITNFVCDFVNSDKLGLISNQHLIISDQARNGLHDKKCILLAELHSKAVDFAKSGTPVQMNMLPKKYHPFLPDYHVRDGKLDDQTKYYNSYKALGVLFRRIKVRTVSPRHESPGEATRLPDYPIFKELLSQGKKHLPQNAGKEQEQYVKEIFNAYVQELKGLRSIFSLGRSPLTEAEVFMGVILEQTNNRRRDDTAIMMREVTGQLVDKIRSLFMGYKEDPLHVWLARSLYGFQWAYSPAASTSSNGVVIEERRQAQCSFGMLAVRCAFECLEVYNKRRPDSRRPKSE